MRALRHVVAFLCLLAVATPVHAEEPKGWLEWSWGTPMAAMNKDDSWCHGRTKWDQDDQWNRTITCPHYRIADVHIPLLVMHFKPDDTLSGYSMFFSSDGRMRDVVVEKFGPPTARHRRMLEWRWPSGTAALLMELCPASGRSCLMGPGGPASRRRRCRACGPGRLRGGRPELAASPEIARAHGTGWDASGPG